MKSCWQIFVKRTWQLIINSANIFHKDEKQILSFQTKWEAILKNNEEPKRIPRWKILLDVQNLQEPNCLVQL